MRLNATPTPAPIKVFSTLISAATFGLVTPRINMALIGASIACSPSRKILASSSEAAITAPRLHQVRPIQIDTSVATRTPAKTAPTLTAPILSVERSEEHTSELQSRQYIVCRLLLEKK